MSMILKVSQRCLMLLSLRQKRKENNPMTFYFQIQEYWDYLSYKADVIFGGVIMQDSYWGHHCICHLQHRHCRWFFYWTSQGARRWSAWQHRARWGASPGKCVNMCYALKTHTIFFYSRHNSVSVIQYLAFFDNLVTHWIEQNCS